jgi:hypothetical protein
MFMIGILSFIALGGMLYIAYRLGYEVGKKEKEV